VYRIPLIDRDASSSVKPREQAQLALSLAHEMIFLVSYALHPTLGRPC
jgi:hypothetical protein